MGYDNAIAFQSNHTSTNTNTNTITCTIQTTYGSKNPTMGLRSVANASKSPLPSFKEDVVTLVTALLVLLLQEYDDGANANAVVARVERRIAVFVVVFIFLIVWRSMCDGFYSNYFMACCVVFSLFGSNECIE